MNLEFVRTYWLQAKTKGRNYWIRAALVGVIGLAFGHWLAATNPLLLKEMRFSMYQALSDWTLRAPSIGNILVVEITDAEYWKGELAGRAPIKRNYLGELVRRLSAAGVKVIALDVDLRSPVTDGTLADHKDYEIETGQLALAIQSASQNQKIVLPRTLNCTRQPCVIESSVLDAYAFNSSAVAEGHINLNRDIRQIPVGGADGGPTGLDSFAQAIARAEKPDSLEALHARSRLRFASFVWPSEFVRQNGRLTAGDVFRLSPGELRHAVAHKTVIIGAAWSTLAYMRGPVVDSRLTPIGYIPGVYLHANYAGAMVDYRVYNNLAPSAAVAVELALVAIVAFLFAIDIRARARWLVITTVALVLMFLTYVFWQNLGIVLEVLIPILLLLLHAFYDEYHCAMEELATFRERFADSKPTPLEPVDRCSSRSA